MLTGRNHHAIGLAAITEAATGYPGNFGNIPKSAATIAELLKQNGYNTMALGKWHLAPYTAYTAAGPFDRWPLGMGFEKYYGFLGGETDQWAPLLAMDNHFIDTPTRSGYHLTEDLVDRTIADIRDQQQANTGRPFFTYVALGAAHAPLHAPKEFIAKYRGKFVQGWAKVREETFDRQKKLALFRRTQCCRQSILAFKRGPISRPTNREFTAGSRRSSPGSSITQTTISAEYSRLSTKRAARPRTRTTRWAGPWRAIRR